MHQWQELLKIGNQFFNNASLMDAQMYYEDAVHLIEYEWSQDNSNPELLFGWVAAMHNLADLYEKQTANSKALNYLKRAHEQVFIVANDPQQTPSMQMLGLRASSITMKKLMAFAQQNDICDDCLDAIEKQHHHIDQAQPHFH